MLFRCSLFIAIAAVVLGHASAVSAGDAEAGKALAGARCAACHGQNGISAIPLYPSLAGQHEAYLVSALKAYRSGQRAGGQAAIMQGQAASLSDEQIDDLAAYFARLPASGGQ